MPDFDDLIVAEDGVVGTDPNEALPLFTMSRMLAATGVGVSTGVGYGVRCVAQKSATVTKMAMCTNGSTPSTLTALYLAVCDVNGVPLEQTSDVHTSITTANTLYTPDSSPGTQVTGLALTTSLVVTAGTAYHLAIYWAGTTLGVAGITARAAGMMGALGGEPALIRSQTGYGGGSTLPTLGTIAGTTVMPWLAAY